MLVRVANMEDPDQTASSEAVWSGSVMFCLDLFDRLAFKFFEYLLNMMKHELWDV